MKIVSIVIVEYDNHKIMEAMFHDKNCNHKKLFEIY